MQSLKLKTILKTAGLAAGVFLLTVNASFADVGLTAKPTSVMLPDGRSVPMWGLFCASDSNTIPGTDPTCTAMDGTAQNSATWQPPLIRVQTGTTLTINLTNSLPGSVPTSLMIVGQLGAGLGMPTKKDSPKHVEQGTTWPAQGEATDPVFTPPVQLKRIQSFGTEVAQGTTAGLTWAALKAGTYLIESGTHPSIQGPMGLYGVLIVSDSATQGYAGVTYDKDVPLLLSEIDAVQNAAVGAAVGTPGFSETAVRLLRNRVSSVSLATDMDGNVINAGSGYSVGTLLAPNVTFSGGGGSGAVARVSEVGPGGSIVAVEVIDGGHDYSSAPVPTATGGTGAQLVAAMILAGIKCSDGDTAAAACYPPAVNYDPRYYLINGIAFDSTHRPASTFEGPGAAADTGRVLLRFVNAGLRIHVPTVVGLDMHLIAEDGNVLPGIPKIQNEVFLAAGKTYDVSVEPSQTSGAYDAKTYPVFDRQLSLSTNNQRDGGMQGYISVNGGGAAAAARTAAAVDDHYFLVPGNTLKISDPSKGMIANDANVYGVTVITLPANAAPGGFKWNPDGTFSYTPSSASVRRDRFVYQANGGPGLTATVFLHECTAANGCLGGPPTANGDTYTSNIATRLQISPPGILANDTDPHGHPLTASLVGASGGTVTLNPDGSFVAKPSSPPSGAGTATVTFTYNAVNSQNTSSATGAGPATVTVNFNGATGLQVRVLDGPSTLPLRTPIELTDYRWIIEEDRTFHVDTTAQVNTGGYIQNIGTNFHSSYMPLTAQGCVGTLACEALQTVLDKETGQHVPAVCDIGNGDCRKLTNPEDATQAPVDPSEVHLDPTKHYYISVLPGDGANPVLQGSGGPVEAQCTGGQYPGKMCGVDTDCPGGGHCTALPAPRPFSTISDCPDPSDFTPGTGTCGHGMGGAPIALGQASVDVKVQQTPFPPAKISLFVFEDDNPLNGEADAGGGIDVLAPNEPGLGGFNIVLLDQAGGLGDSTGQPTYDMFNMPLSNSLAGRRDPVTNLDACPISPSSVVRNSGVCADHLATHCTKNTDCPSPGEACIKTTSDGLVGMIVTCPKYESDGKTLSPLAGQAVIANLYPGLYEVVATPGADRLARGEEWLQTNTLDGTKPHEAFIRPSEPAYFQEFGPAGFHVAIGFANPAIINGRRPQVCAGLPSGSCNHTVTGQVSLARISRTPDERIYGSGSFDALGFTSCYVSLGDPGASDIAFTKCDSKGKFKFTGIPSGNHKITVFDQWNDIIVDGLSLPVMVPSTGNIDVGELAMMQWRTNLATRTFFDKNKDGVSQGDEPGLPLLATNVRYRDGSFMGFNNTDLDGYAGFNEIFPFFNWMVIEADTARYKQTGVHVVYDAGGPADGSGNPDSGNSAIAASVANTKEVVPLPDSLRVPGAVYCSGADCSSENRLTDPNGGGATGSTGRVDPPWVTTEGWQGFAGQTQFFEFGKTPFEKGENGGVKGHVIYASTRPFDDPRLLLQLSWEPMVPNVTVNLYKKGTAPDGTESLTLVDTTKTSSWDEWAQGFHTDSGGHLVPNMNCPGQDPTSLFFFTLKDSKQLLNPGVDLPEHSQFKCYDGMAILNQAQPAPYDGMYQFPSVTARDATTGQPAGTNCTGCIDNPADLLQGRHIPMLPPSKYVVEMIVPPGYELVKEEDKNILLGDVYIAPVTQQFGGLGSIFIMPDQAEVDSEFNPNNPLNATNNEGVQPRHEGDTGSVEAFWPCVGQLRVVPDYMSLFPQAQQAAPFAGASRNLCDRKEVTLEDQASVLAKFYVFTSTHVAAHFTGIITDDFASEFDPFSPNYGEKFAVPNLPISFKDWMGSEVARAYSDQWGFYNGLHYSTWEVNPPNPTGYGPQMVVACMNDKGSLPDGSSDPLYNPGYSQFCYEWSMMPGQTSYLDTPVVPVMAFAEGHNPPDCAYPDYTPAIKQVDGDGIGPWVRTLTGEVTQVTVVNPGAGYISRPTVTFQNGGTGGSGAAAANTATTGTFMRVTEVRPGAIGNGYRGVPSVSFGGGGGGSGASATASMKVNLVNVPSGDGGSGYTASPSVTFPGGSGGVFPVTMRVSSIVLSNRGAGYTGRPTTTFNNVGTGGAGAAAANGTATGTFLSVTNVVRSAGGSGYTSPPAVSIALPPCTLNGTTCVRAVYHANISGGAVTSFTQDNPGAGYTSRPAVTINNTGSGGTGAAAANTATTGTFLSINRVVVSAGGAGYTTRPAVTFSAPPAGSPGSTPATATNSGTTSGTFLSVNAVGVTNGGSGYTGMNGTFSGGNGSGASAVASLNLAAVNLIANGSGYTARPTVSIDLPPRTCVGGPTPGITCTINSDCGGSGGSCSSGTAATASAFMSLDQVILSSGGSGYNSTPGVTISTPGCTINGTTCVRATAHAEISTSSTIKITALGDMRVPNHAYSGPQATTAPFNEPFIMRHYGFGAQCTDTGHCSSTTARACTQDSDCPGSQTCVDPACKAVSSVTIGGVDAPITSWSDSEIRVAVPGGVPPCDIQQIGHAGARCGQLVITAGNGKQSVDTVTVTIGGKAPTYVEAENAGQNAIQTAIDNATPGDLIIVKPGSYKEMVIMWKPVRLQGVGAASVTINADPHPSGTKLDAWREKILCLFGLGPDGQPGGCPIQVDRVPLEPIVGWQSFLNGNLAELLLEPTLVGAYEGAGITVVGKGVDYHGADPFGGADLTFPAGTTMLTGSGQDCEDYPSNFLCNPSRIDGLTITNSSQGGGGIFVHGWNHHLEISNNRIFANAGTLTGGISVGQGEFGDPNIAPAPAAIPPLTTAQFPDLNSFPDGTQLPYWLNTYVNVHNNSVTQNASYGDSLNSTTPAAAGGVTFCSGSDYYNFRNNWVCGNLSSGDGGGVAHLGFSWNDANGGITHNAILFNQSNNPTLPTSGGGLLVSGAGPDGQTNQCELTGALCDPTDTHACHDGADGACVLLECGTIIDVDCAPGLSEGTGPGLVIDSNLFQGNTAESGSGGAMRLQMVNGAEVGAFPTHPENWYQVKIQNNIIVDNVAGWDGGGVSMQDALRVTFANNSVLHNDTTASAGVLFSSLAAPTASTPPCTTCAVSTDQPAGLVTMGNTDNLVSSLPGTVTCPTDGGVANPYSGMNCKTVSLPVLANNVFWQNRAFHIEVTDPSGTGPQGQQSSVALNPVLNQSSTGECVTGGMHPPRYWDIGVRGDTAPGTHMLNPRRSVLTDASLYAGPGSDNTGDDPMVARAYCNGSRVPPENGGMGYLVPPGVAQENIPNPVFTLTPVATVDESNNWINMSYGPLSMVGPDGQIVLGQYVPTSSSAATINGVPSGSDTYALAPSLDFFGNPRNVPSSHDADIGAVEYPPPAGGLASLSSLSLSFGRVLLDSLSATQDLTVTNPGPADLTVNNPDFTAAVGFIRAASTTAPDCGTGSTFALGAGASCAIGIRFAPTTSTGGAISYEATLTISTTSAGDVPQFVVLTGTSAPATFACSDPGTPDGAACDDGNACTRADTCQNGVCVGGNPVTCVASDSCHGVGTCDTGTGLCSNPTRPDGTVCDDGNACSQTDTCVAGLCTGLLSVVEAGSTIKYVANPSSNETVLIQKGTGMTYYVNTTAPAFGMSWVNPGFVESGWSSGVYGVGYETAPPGAVNLIQTPVTAGAYSVFTRTSVVVPSAAAVGRVLVSADYDDGFAVWINGTEVYRSPEIPAGAPAWNTNTALHESSNAAVPNYGSLTDITTAARALLHDGPNLVAIGVWNSAAPTSTDLVLVPWLSIVDERPPEAVLIQKGTGMTYYVNTTAPAFGMNWVNPGFVESGWSSGVYGVGYETAPPGAVNLIQTPVTPAPGTYSVFTRTNVVIPSVAAVNRVLVGADYDDGFAVWINGTEVYRSTTLGTGALAWNTNAALHESSNAVEPNYGPLTDITTVARAALHDGLNLVAIGVWNSAALTSTDLVLVPRLSIGDDWTSPAFSEAPWTTGTYGVGYETAPPGATALLHTTVPAGTYSVFTRAHFNVAAPGAVTEVLLGADYDDGYIAYINGTEVFRSYEMPDGAPTWNTNAALHESSNGTSPNYGTPINITAAALAALVPGDNVLAVGVWNSAALTSTDLVLVPRLQLRTTFTSCAASDQCHTAGTCNPTTGTCSSTALADGTPCNDGNACTQSDTCQAGVCTGGAPVICASLDQCRDAGVCDPATGGCADPGIAVNKPDGTPCNDGNDATCGDSCVGGVCRSGTDTAGPNEVNASVTVAQQGSSATIGWADSAGQFNVYRGSISPDQWFWYNHGCLNPAGPTAVESLSDTVAPPLGKAFYYLVTRLNACAESIPGTDSAGSPIPTNYICPGVGDGVSIAALSPSLETGATTAHRGTITLTYTGLAPLTLTAAPAVTTTFGSGAFAIVGGTCASGLTINPSGECTVVVEYTPPGNDNPSTATVSITGTGAVPGGGTRTYTSESFNAD